MVGIYRYLPLCSTLPTYCPHRVRRNVSTVSKVRTIFEAMTDFSHVEMDVMFIRHAESQNNALYEQIREELGHDISEEELDREESVRRNPDPCITQLGKRC